MPIAAERMTQLREGQKRAIEMLFADLSNSLAIYSRGFTADEAVQAFTAGFDQLADAPTDPGATTGAGELLHRQADQTDPAGDRRRSWTSPRCCPTTTRSDTCKSTTRFRRRAPRPRPRTPGDGSAWSAANVRFNNYFREIATRFEYRDAMLLDTRGNVVYNVNKGPALGTNILTGPYRASNLRGAYEKAMAADSVDFVWITDFQPFQAAGGMPIAWLVSPIGAAGKTSGVMALPLPISKVNRIMTADQHWKAAGMGATAETYLAGPDGLMRSDSRLFLQDPEKYQRDAVAAGTPPDIVAEAMQMARHHAGAARRDRGVPRRAARADRNSHGYRLSGRPGTRGVRPGGHPEFRSALVDPGHPGQRRGLLADRGLHPHAGRDGRGDGLRAVCARDADCPKIRRPHPAAAGRRGGDQRRKLRRHDTGHLARRDRRSHCRFQRDEPESGDQGRAAHRTAQGKRPPAAVADARSGRAALPRRRADHCARAPGRDGHLRRHHRPRRDLQLAVR